MVAQRLARSAKIYIAFVDATGLLLGVLLILGIHRIRHDLPAVLIFGVVGVLAGSINLSARTAMPSRIVHQMSSSFVYPLLLLAEPGAVCLVLMTMALTDKVLWRRSWLTTTFNMAQLCIGTAAGASVLLLFNREVASLNLLEAHSLVAGFAAILTLALVNHGLTHGVLSLANGQPLFRWSWITRIGVLNETLCIVSGLGMAVLWTVRPGLAVLGAIPVWTMIFIIDALHRREQALQEREDELQTLQGLGLEIGSELMEAQLHAVVLRIVSQALNTRQGLIASLDRRQGDLVVCASRGFASQPPDRLALDGFDPDFFDADRIVLVEGRQSVARFTGLDFLEVPGMLMVPLAAREHWNGALILTRDDDRRPFAAEDIRRLETLSRFIDVSLENAHLLTEHRTMQAQLIQTEKMSALGMLVSGVAHELNNPLTSVLGYSELLTARENDPKRREILLRVGAEAKRAAKIVQNLLAFSRKHKPTKTEVDLNETLTQVLGFRAYELKVHNVQIERSLAPALPPVMADPHQIQQVMLNLITNAEQTVIGHTSSATITATTRRLGDTVQLAISDNGPGIRPEHLKQIFLPFFTTKEVGRGTGLGLSICYGIVEEHGGRIEAFSGPEGGASFVVTLPIAVNTETEPDVPASLPPEASLPEFRGRMLVVDDEESILFLVTDYFQALGWTVLSASEGAGALELVDSTPFDVMLVDLRMPGMDGESFFRTLQERYPETVDRVIFFTGDAGSAATSVFVEGLENIVLRKPFELSALAESVERVAHRGEQAQPTGP